MYPEIQAMRTQSTLLSIMLLLLAAGGCGNNGKKLEPHLAEYGAVPPFRFTEAMNRPIGREDLAGKAWIADFIFTHCAGPCPLLSKEMSALHAEFDSVPNLRFVSFTVDPERDSASVLREYGERYGANPDRWYFLTGPRADLHSLAYNGFHIGDRDNPIFHSTYLILVDGAGRIRGYYDGLERSQLQRLRKEVRQLLAEEPG